MPTANPQKPRLRFRRSGGVRQVVMQRAVDLPALLQLDPKDWMALSCPALGHEMDDRTLAAMDTDADGRLRIRELREVIQWLESILRDLSVLEDGNDSVALGDIREDTLQGEQILSSIRHLLSLLDSSSAGISLAQLDEGRSIMETVPMNGDGIVDHRAAEDAEVRRLMDDIIATIGPVPTRQGTEGVTRATLEAFFAACSAFSEWHASGHSEEAREQLFFLGEHTESATGALEQVDAKIDEWFTLCRTRNYAPDLVKGNLEAEDLEARPLAELRDIPTLPLTHALNPAWTDRVDRFRMQVLAPLHEQMPAELGLAEWQSLLERFAPYREWRRRQPGSAVSKLGIDAVNAWLGDGKTRGDLEKLLEADLELKDEIDGVREVERLLLLKRDFWEFVHNFVNFDRFYDLFDQAIFQVGVLYLDGRSFHLCVPVTDHKSHIALAVRSGLYLVYCQLSRPGEAAGPLIAVAVTNGDSRRLIPGKHGVFYDRENVEWDARIIQIIEHPINLRQAVLEPFKRLGGLLVGHMEKLSSSREKSLQADMVKGVTQAEAKVAQVSSGEAAAQQEARPGGGVGGFMAGGGVAIAAVTSSLALLSSTLSRINPVYFLFAFLCILALILLPTAFVAWWRLRGRDIGLLLEAGGWAINAPMRLTGALGRQLTKMARRR